MEVQINKVRPRKQNEGKVLDAFGSFSPEHNIKSKNEQTYFTRSLTTQDLGSFQEVDLSARGLEEVNLTIGNELSYGLSIGQNKKWMFGAQYTEVNSANFSNPFIKSKQHIIIYTTSSI